MVRWAGPIGEAQSGCRNRVFPKLRVWADSLEQRVRRLPPSHAVGAPGRSLQIRQECGLKCSPVGRAGYCLGLLRPFRVWMRESGSFRHCERSIEDGGSPFPRVTSSRSFQGVQNHRHPLSANEVRDIGG